MNEIKGTILSIEKTTITMNETEESVQAIEKRCVDFFASIEAKAKVTVEHFGDGALILIFYPYNKDIKSQAIRLDFKRK